MTEGNEQHEPLNLNEADPSNQHYLKLCRSLGSLTTARYAHNGGYGLTSHIGSTAISSRLAPHCRR